MGLVRLPMSEGRAFLDATAQRKLGANVKTKGGVRPAHKRGVPNKLEASWMATLQARLLAGKIKAFYFEAITLQLADGVRYTPDFFIIHNDNSVEINETKGFMREDARVKLRVAANTYRHWKVLLIQWDRKAKNWTITPVNAVG